MERVSNWAGNITYAAQRIVRPRSIEEAQELVASNEKIRALGTRHSFTLVADSSATLLSTEHLNGIVEIGDGTVTVEAGIRYGELGSALHARGLAVQNFASLPHISVGGAIATSTHGSGARNQSLAAGVSALELVGADGSVTSWRRGEAGFQGAVVSLGALGLVTRVSLDVVPAFDLRQYVFEQLPWASVETDLDTILAAGYSVSLFTLWDEPAVGTAWVKTADELPPGMPFFGARPASAPLNPVPDSDWENATEQLGMPGPSHDRLPHFRLGFTPSSGAELQTEFLLPREHGAAAVAELRALAASIAPLLLVSEIRSIASDALWLSPFYERDSVAFHFTWKPLPAEVLALLPRIESALAPFGARPHWGKLFLTPAAYPRHADFIRLAEQLDPGAKFRNDFVERHLFDLSREASAS